MKSPADITIDDIPNAKEVLRKAIKTLATGTEAERQAVRDMFQDITVAEFIGGPFVLRLQ